MSMHPADIITRDMAVAKTITDRPRRPLRQESPKNLAWMRKNIRGFSDMRDATERRLADEEANRRKMGVRA